MINLLQLNKLVRFLFFFTFIIFNSNLYAAEDIWKKKETETKQIQEDDEEKITIDNPTLPEDINKIEITINEEEIDNFEQAVVGIFDPEENNFNLDMWSQSNGDEVKKIIKKINKMKLSNFSENLLFKVLFTNAYPPQNNLTSEEFLNIKINWLIKNKRFKDFETLLKTNPIVGNHPEGIKTLVNEYLSTADIKSACDKVKFLGKDVNNDYLDKFTIYCLINKNRKDEAQLLFDLSKERGLKDSFYENKINYLLGNSNDTSQKIIDKNLLSFYLSHITSDNFEYEPTEKTDKYIWKYLSSANLIKTKDFENEELILTYEKAASEEAFDNDEIFKIYLQMNFNFNQLLNSREIYKNLPSYKSRALIYQSLILSDNVETKLQLAFLLKDIFKKDKLTNVYRNEFINILKSIDANDIPENYVDVVKENLEKGFQDTKKIKFDNEIIHRSKVIKHFLDDYDKKTRTEKDFKTVYKKIKKNKKYFISIMDIIVLESLEADGINLPNELNLEKLSSEMTVPENLNILASENQIGFLMLKIIEIIGEDKTRDLDPETIYFLTKILNDLELKKIRNDILKETLPLKV